MGEGCSGFYKRGSRSKACTLRCNETEWVLERSGKGDNGETLDVDECRGWLWTRE